MTASASIASDIVKPPSVLIVDDDEQVLNVHARGLSLSGFEVTTAASGQAALVMLKEQSFDVILSDIDMPGMNGIQLLTRVRAHDMDVPVILITGVPSLETAVQMCRELGIDVIAEGIESTAERDTVVSLGCPLLQGFLFGRPEPEPSAAAFEA